LGYPVQQSQLRHTNQVILEGMLFKSKFLESIEDIYEQNSKVSLVFSVHFDPGGKIS